MEGGARPAASGGDGGGGGYFFIGGGRGHDGKNGVHGRRVGACDSVVVGRQRPERATRDAGGAESSDESGVGRGERAAGKEAQTESEKIYGVGVWWEATTGEGG